MFRIIAVAILVVGILAACDDGPTGPNATRGGQVDLKVTFNYRFSSLSCGVGYRFIPGYTIELPGPRADLGTYSDMDLWPDSPKQYGIYAKPKRIYHDGEPVDHLILMEKESVTFNLRPQEDKARCEITLKNVSFEYFPEEKISVSEFVMLYKIEIY